MSLPEPVESYEPGASFRAEIREQPRALRRLLVLNELPTFYCYAVPDLVEAAHRCVQRDTSLEAI